VHMEIYLRAFNRIEINPPMKKIVLFSFSLTFFFQ
jgi:hypothetical protein